MLSNNGKFSCYYGARLLQGDDDDDEVEKRPFHPPPLWIV